jgi:hypothetical protein
MAFGLSNAPTNFMFLMNGVFGEYLDKFVIVFMDDKLIYSKTEKEHEQHLRMVLQVLREHKLYVKISKLIFYQNKIHYLGHIILDNGITIVPEKVEAIRGWPMPRNFMKVLAPKMNLSLWLHFVVDSMAIGSFLKFGFEFF